MTYSYDLRIKALDFIEKEGVEGKSKPGLTFREFDTGAEKREETGYCQAQSR